MTTTFEFPLSGGNKFELVVSDLMTASDFERMKNVIELARDSLVITADEAARELVGVLELRLADEATNEKESDDGS